MINIIPILEYVGSTVTASSMYIRVFPKLIIWSFWISLLGSTFLFTYTILTEQYGLSFLNIQSILMNIVGLWKWRNIKIKEE